MEEQRTATLVDGNAIAGLLEDAFAGDVTMLVGTCDECGASAVLAEAVVELDAAAAIVQCRACTHTLFTVLTSDGAVRLRFGALREIRRNPVSRAGE
jgi:Family of unknown function (DUF6510)